MKGIIFTGFRDKDVNIFRVGEDLILSAIGTKQKFISPPTNGFNTIADLCP
jgi:hypothetical protein